VLRVVPDRCLPVFRLEREAESASSLERGLERERAPCPSAPMNFVVTVPRSLYDFALAYVATIWFTRSVAVAGGGSGAGAAASIHPISAIAANASFGIDCMAE
jgi:hypothetical protein